MGVDYVETQLAMSCQFNSLYGVASGTHAIQFSNGTWTAANAAGGCLVSEVSGVLYAGFDKGAFADGNSTGPLTTASTGALGQANEIYFAAASGFTMEGCLATPTGGPGTFTTLAHSYTNFGDWCLAQQIAPSSTAAVTVTFGTSGNSQKWMAAVATYKGLAPAAYLTGQLATFATGTITASGSGVPLTGQRATLSAGNMTASGAVGSKSGLLLNSSGGF
jgi:hypothetical protein